ncbi:sugar O-acyltransferase, sialic acid O-acetyltransferase NeuD family [Chryseobacterium sp. RU37D]|uniref:NeuD/PglB/VioB family sugar acetyltransferase n=1 Tax=Chryseobacterium sp. RU37D TaxID=1907397 RepID=UPI000954E10C|nr:NeuD/PglB/VioB family sugar acetyltransferase [Chryseobacterium sp. RU37D]SIQ04430.1 sugar O-acyltransferase, sialic acid O-acetyltransferase NeuD family [Chryseobacterium sp. RU37D]
MLIIGAKGFAKEVLEICHQNNDLINLAFYDDVNDDVFGNLYNQFPVLKHIQNAEEYFKTIDEKFTIGIGNPVLRKKLADKFTEAGGKLTSVISPKADIGSYGISIGQGANILDGVKISNDVSIGLAPIVYYNSVITHDVEIGDFVEISPDVKILGRAGIGSFCQLGAGSIILPDIKIGNNVIIGAGAVVTKHIPDNCVAVGVPAKIIKTNTR